ncbi:unnamed protein product [Arabidopsis thaliana]|uniref:Uncharacterized protein n=1 Tax=Arabidopsis thaliana TaxID=3702 RepID=Q9LJM9_ARATH|nr:unnamed protein product [Arabidopsis thaliana]
MKGFFGVVVFQFISLTLSIATRGIISVASDLDVAKKVFSSTNEMESLQLPAFYVQNKARRVGPSVSRYRNEKIGTKRSVQHLRLLHYFPEQISELKDWYQVVRTMQHLRPLHHFPEQISEQKDWYQAVRTMQHLRPLHHFPEKISEQKDWYQAVRTMQYLRPLHHFPEHILTPTWIRIGRWSESVKCN